MARTYELGFIVDPRQTDDAVQEIVQRYREMIEESGSTVTEVDYWGRRKLAYPIQNFNEGKYVFLFITSESGSPPFTEIERLLRQNDKVLRFLTVRTDQDLKRAARKGKPGTPGGPAKPAPPEEVAGAPTEAVSAEAVSAEAPAAAETASTGAAMNEPKEAVSTAAASAPETASEEVASEPETADAPAKPADAPEEAVATEPEEAAATEPAEAAVTEPAETAAEAEPSSSDKEE